PLGKFYKVDLSSMKDVEKFTDEVTKDVEKNGIDYLILSAGGPPTGMWRRGPEVPSKGNMSLMVGIGESICCTMSFTVRPSRSTALTVRFYTTYRLLPVVKASVIVIGSPGFGAFYDESDPGFEKPENKQKMTFIRQGRRDCLYLD